MFLNFPSNTNSSNAIGMLGAVRKYPYHTNIVLIPRNILIIIHNVVIMTNMDCKISAQADGGPHFCVCAST